MASAPAGQGLVGFHRPETQDALRLAAWEAHFDPGDVLYYTGGDPPEDLAEVVVHHGVPLAPGFLETARGVRHAVR